MSSSHLSHTYLSNSLSLSLYMYIYIFSFHFVLKKSRIWNWRYELYPSTTHIPCPPGFVKILICSQAGLAYMVSSFQIRCPTQRQTFSYMFFPPRGFLWWLGDCAWTVGWGWVVHGGYGGLFLFLLHGGVSRPRGLPPPPSKRARFLIHFGVRSVGLLSQKK